MVDISTPRKHIDVLDLDQFLAYSDDVGVSLDIKEGEVLEDAPLAGLCDAQRSEHQHPRERKRPQRQVELLPRGRLSRQQRHHPQHQRPPIRLPCELRPPHRQVHQGRHEDHRLEPQEPDDAGHRAGRHAERDPRDEHDPPDARFENPTSRRRARTSATKRITRAPTSG